MFRRYWETVFRIDPEDNEEFDREHEQEIENYITDNVNRIEPYRHADLSRLEANNPLTKPIEMWEIKIIIKNFKDKAPGESGIRKTIIQNMPDIAIRKLKDIYNWALSMGYFPIKFKNAVMIFISKPNKDPQKVQNYRPISLLEIPGKIFEKILTNRITLHMENNNLFNQHQYGFRKGRGTQLALAALYETVALSQKKRYQCNVVCRDISKAFDKIWKHGLYFKLLQANLPSIIEKVLCNFNENRTATIKIENVIGEKFQLLSGVPQGSVLSPLLFIFYTAKIESPAMNCIDISFADDNTQIIEYPLRSKEILALRTEEEIKRINEYEKKWKIKTNKSKFQLLSISATKPHDVNVDQQRITFNNKISVLGLEMGTRGVASHAKRRLNLARTQYGKLKRFKNMKTKILIHFYKTLIRPIMEYPVIPLCISSKTNIKKFQQFQNKVIRNATRRNEEDNGLTIQELHQKYKIEAINTRLHRLTKKIWDKLVLTNEDLTNQSREEDDNDTDRDHSWWKRISPYVNGVEPQPSYVQI